MNIVIYEPTLKTDNFEKLQVISDFDEFKKLSNVILANRLDDSLKDIKDKIHQRFIYTGLKQFLCLSVAF